MMTMNFINLCLLKFLLLVSGFIPKMSSKQPGQISYDFAHFCFFAQTLLPPRFIPNFHSQYSLRECLLSKFTKCLLNNFHSQGSFRECLLNSLDIFTFVVNPMLPPGKLEIKVIFLEQFTNSFQHQVRLKIS